MKCPSCEIAFHPQMADIHIGQNANGANVRIYYQMCPSCKEPIVGYKEFSPNDSKQYFQYPFNEEGLIILKKR